MFLSAVRFVAFTFCSPLHALTTVSSGINNRLLRAHRPFMAIGYTDPKYAYSQKVALHSAKEIIAVQKLLMAAPQYRPTSVLSLHKTRSRPILTFLPVFRLLSAASSTDGSSALRSSSPWTTP